MLNFSPPRYHRGRKPTGAKLALKPVHVWGIRIRLQVACKARDLALFDLALDPLALCSVSWIPSVRELKKRALGSAQRASLLFGYLSGREALSKFALSEEVTHLLDDWLVIAESYRRGCARPADPDKPIHQA
jgi:hypothetical protein